LEFFAKSDQMIDFVISGAPVSQLFTLFDQKWLGQCHLMAYPSGWKIQLVVIITRILPIQGTRSCR